MVKTKGELTRHNHPTPRVLPRLARQPNDPNGRRGHRAGPGQLYVVPRGVSHQPVSVNGAEVVLIEPSSTVNTGDTPSDLTASGRVVKQPLTQSR